MRPSKGYLKRRRNWTSSFKEACKVAWKRETDEHGDVHCQECGCTLLEPRAHNFDHIEAAGMGRVRDNSPENIRVVCYPCHTKKTTGKRPKNAEWIDR